MSYEYHLKLKGQKAVVLNKKQWEALRQKDPTTGEWYIPRDDKIVRSKDGSEFNLRNYDGCTPVWVEDRSPYFQKEHAHVLTDAERGKAHAVMVEAKCRWILKTGKGYGKLTEEERQVFVEVKKKIQVESFSQGPDWEKEQNEKREFDKEFWDVYFATTEDRQETFLAWQQGRKSYPDPRNYDRRDFLRKAAKEATNDEIYSRTARHRDGDSGELPGSNLNQATPSASNQPALLG